jgi:hypothetical protein
MRKTTLCLVILTTAILTSGAAAQDGVLFVENDRVGIGISTPASELHLLTGTITIGGHTNGERPGTPVDFQITGLRNVIYNIDSDNNSNNASFSVSRDGSANAVVFVTREDGRTGINIQFPSHPLHVGTGPTNGNGAHLTAAGVWVNGSSRTSKENIRSLSEQDALTTLADLDPVLYTGKGAADGEEYVGFIAEDVPEMVAVADRSGVSPMDVVAVLTRVVQVQQRSLDEQRAVNQALEQRLQELEARLTAAGN